MTVKILYGHPPYIYAIFRNLGTNFLSLSAAHWSLHLLIGICILRSRSGGIACPIARCIGPILILLSFQLAAKIYPHVHLLCGWWSKPASLSGNAPVYLSNLFLYWLGLWAPVLIGHLRLVGTILPSHYLCAKQLSYPRYSWQSLCDRDLGACTML